MAISMPETGPRSYTPETTIRICTPRGTEAAELRPTGALSSVAVGPRNEGLLLLLTVPSWNYTPADGDDEFEDDTEEDEDVVLVHVEEPFPAGAFETGNGFEIPDAAASRVHTVATSLDQGLVFLLATNGDVERDLLAVAMPQGSFEVLYRSAVPYDTLLVQDRHARSVVAVPMGESSPGIVPLGPDEPEPFPRGGFSRNDELQAFTRFQTTFCHRTTGEANAGVMLRIAMLEGISRVDMRRFSRNFEADHRDDADARCQMCLALRRVGMDEEELGQITRFLVKDHPRHAGAALLMADVEAKDGRWEDALQRLQGLDVTTLDEGRACHYHHLLGLSLLHLSRPKEALEAFETGSGHERGICPLDSLIDLARALADPLEVGDWGAGQPVVRQLVGAVRRADEALAKGDAAAARDALEKPVMWRAEERQSAARLAAAYLESESPTPNERFLKRHALAFFCHVARNAKPDSLEVVLPGMSWDEDRLIELGRRARAWLGDRT